MAKEARARSPEREPDPDFTDTGEQTDAMGRPLLIDEPDDRVDPPADDGDEQRRITERRARAQGWVPQDQYRGDSATWVDAETFLEKGYGNNDILRERIDRLADRLAERDGVITELNTRVAESGQVLQSLNNRFINADRNAYSRGIADAEARMRKAALDADGEAYDEAKADRDALEARPVVEKPADQPPARTTQPARQAVDAVTNQWVKENSSWWSDDELSDATIVIHKRLMRENPNMGQIEGYNAAKAEMMRRYPEKFENPRRSARGGVGAPSGDRMNGNGKSGSNGRIFANLPEDAKKEFAKTRTAMGPDKKTGKPYFTEQMFLDQYTGEFVR